MHKINTLKKRIEKLHGQIEVDLFNDKLRLEKKENDYQGVSYGNRQTEPNMGLIIIGVFMLIFVVVAFQGFMEILNAFGNFLYSNWVIILILFMVIAGVEIWRISKEGLNGIYKFEKIIFAISIVAIFMIFLMIFF